MRLIIHCISKETEGDIYVGEQAVMYAGAKTRRGHMEHVTSVHA